MSSITTINSGDLISGSRTDINTNFTNLNNGKIETSTLDTDTALAANSDSKIATQKAVKAYVDAGGNVNASETTKGIVEEATDAEVTAGTASGATGAKLFVTPAKLLTRTNALLPGVTSVKNQSAFPCNGVSNMNTVVTNTVLRLGRIIIPNTILQATKFTFGVESKSVNGTVKVALFSEDGQTQIFTFTTATITAAGNISTTITAVNVIAGVYYIAILPVSTVNITPAAFTQDNFGIANVTSEPVYDGKVTVTADTMPTTITPGSLTFELGNTMVFQLDK